MLLDFPAGHPMTFVTLRSAIALAITALLCFGAVGCAGLPPPSLIDMEGANLVQHNRDLNDCYEQKSKLFISSGNFVGNCMESKGYKVLRKQ